MNPGDRDAGLKVREMRVESRTKTAEAEMARKVAQRRTSLTGASGARTPPPRPAWITASPTPSLPTRAELSSFWPHSLFPCQGAQLGCSQGPRRGWTPGDLGAKPTLREAAALPPGVAVLGSFFTTYGYGCIELPSPCCSGLDNTPFC